MRRRRKKTLQYRNIIKGRVFELVLRKLIEKAGFKINLDRSEVPQLTKSLKKLHGRGSTYAADLLGVFALPIPFSYPLLLIGEAKNYKKKVPIGEARAFLGAYTDISQYPRINTKSKMFKFSQIFKKGRFTYIPVMFAASGFNKNVQAFLYAHGIYFISYQDSSMLNEIKLGIEDLCNKIDYKKLDTESIKKIDSLDGLTKMKEDVKLLGYDETIKNLVTRADQIRSYIGLVDKTWPVNFLSYRKIAPSTLVRQYRYSIIENEIAIRYMGKFSFPEYFLKEYIKIIGGENKVLNDLTLYIPRDERIYPLYAKLVRYKKPIKE